MWQGCPISFWTNLVFIRRTDEQLSLVNIRGHKALLPDALRSATGPPSCAAITHTMHIRTLRTVLNPVPPGATLSKEKAHQLAIRLVREQIGLVDVLRTSHHVPSSVVFALTQQVEVLTCSDYLLRRHEGEICGWFNRTAGTS